MSGLLRQGLVYIKLSWTCSLLELDFVPYIYPYKIVFITRL